jgi:Mce-associated membrane protein
MAVDAGTTRHAVTEAEATAHEPDDEVPEDDADADVSTQGVDVEQSHDSDAAEAASRRSLRVPALAGTLIVVALAGLVAYLGVRDYHSRQQHDERHLLLQVARQAAVNLTTVDWQHADADIARILGSATGKFYDDFEKRSKPFIDVVERVRSKSVGTVTEAGIESFSGNEAHVLLSVSVATTNPGAPEESPRHWRMRMSVQKAGDGAKVSDVEFVP